MKGKKGFPIKVKTRVKSVNLPKIVLDGSSQEITSLLFFSFKKTVYIQRDAGSNW